MTVKWKKANSVNGYELQYAMNSSFTSGKKTVVLSSPSTITKTLSGLKKKKTYYVRVRTFKKYSNGQKHYSAWSSVKKLKITK